MGNDPTGWNLRRAAGDGDPARLSGAVLEQERERQWGGEVEGASVLQNTSKGMASLWGNGCVNLFYSRVQLSHSRLRLIATPWAAARQASLSITNSRSLLKLVPIQSVMPSNHLVLCHPLLLLPSIFPSIRVFSSEFFSSDGQSTIASASASVLPMNIQD